MKKILKKLLPPFVLYYARALFGYGYSGNYLKWDDAATACEGYDSEIIFEKVKTAVLAVKSGDAACERDSVLFDKIVYSWPMLASLMYAAAYCKGNLHVVDFGGSLGSSYFQNKKFLKSLNLHWSIVEQPKFVAFGQQVLQNDQLKFYPTLHEASAAMATDLVLLSSVLQYLENPYAILDEIANISPKFILIDRTPFSLDEKETIKIQNVPTSIYKASYPIRFIPQSTLLSYLEKIGYNVLEKFDSDIDGDTNNVHFGGIMAQKVSNA